MTYRHRGRSESDGRYRRRVEMMPLSEPCPDCGKYRYFNRKAARKAARRTSPGGSLSIYKCGDYFHIGHTPWQIRIGKAQRSNNLGEFMPSARSS